MKKSILQIHKPIVYFNPKVCKDTKYSLQTYIFVHFYNFPFDAMV